MTNRPEFDPRQIIDFLNLTARLKSEVRHCCDATGARAEEVYGLWHEFEDCRTVEARCAKALDNLEAQLQHNIAPISTWEEREFSMVFTKMDRWCDHDAALQALCETIKQDACLKMEAAGIQPADHKPREIERFD